MERIKSYFESHGVRKRDIPSALVLFKGMGYGVYFGMLIACYRFQPVQRFFKLSGPKYILDSVKKNHKTRYDKWHGFIMKKSEQFAEWKYFKPIPKAIGVKSKKLVRAFAETFVLYKVTLPITLPLQFLVTVSIFKWWHT